MIETRAVDGGIEIRVADNGHGIAPAIRDRIFDPFFTTKPIGKGTGLGLSISYGIVKDHGGSIDFESLPGSGHAVHDPPSGRASRRDPSRNQRSAQGAGTRAAGLNRRRFPGSRCLGTPHRSTA